MSKTSAVQLRRGDALRRPASGSSEWEKKARQCLAPTKLKRLLKGRVLNPPTHDAYSIADRVARAGDEAPAAAVAFHAQIDIGIMHALAWRARAHFEIDRIAAAAVDEAV